MKIQCGICCIKHVNATQCSKSLKGSSHTYKPAILNQSYRQNPSMYELCEYLQSVVQSGSK